MKICVVGTGYVGLVSGACFAEMGHEVICVDINEEKIKNLRQSIIPIYEPGLKEIVDHNLKNKRLTFTTSLSHGVENSLFIFIAVGTPPGADGAADLNQVLGVAKEIGCSLNSFKIIINKSTVPVGTALKVEKVIQQELDKRGVYKPFQVVSNPEFLKEGDAVSDCLRPDRIVVGVNDENTKKLMEELYAPFVRNGNPVLFMDVHSAEVTKYAANAMLATRISFMNELSRLCEVVGADIQDVRRGIGTDSRIGMPFLYAGIGYGGSCFPKDVQALIQTMKSNDLPCSILEAVESVNKLQKIHFLKKINSFFSALNKPIQGLTFAVWGVSFKPKTDDCRDSPSLAIIENLIAQGARVQLYDPEAMDVAKQTLYNNVTYSPDLYSAAQNADAILLMTEWSEFRNPDFDKLQNIMNAKVIFDGRNQFDVKKMKELGWHYQCIGRGKLI